MNAVFLRFGVVEMVIDQVDDLSTLDLLVQQVCNIISQNTESLYSSETW